MQTVHTRFPFQLLQQTENELQRQEDALQRLRSIRNDECDKLRQLVVMNVMDRVVDIVSTTCAMLERICLSECPPKDKWDIPSPVLAAGNSMSTSNVLSLSTVCRLVDERLAATKQTLAGLLEPPLP
ncbi:hypothetical protein BIW11_10043 [Tropilaelaps mercedesae]|uniref:Uncharacterized protein n=1 Tax=Tropilaelaps mercedesae TaxID=418985 RepID=A0A1V9XHF7_9ACAR|nr:hypothetical protein BIW11_10043 [Tropilaelaps mercedesae]